MCAATAVMDGLRAQRAMPHESLDRLFETRPGSLSQPQAEGELPFSAGQATVDAEASAVDRLSGQELWQTIVQEVPDEAERAVLYCSFALGMKPAEIAQRRPDLFPGVPDVYRVKRNVLERLRRNPSIRRFVEEVPEKSGPRRLLE